MVQTSNYMTWLYRKVNQPYKASKFILFIIILVLLVPATLQDTENKNSCEPTCKYCCANPAGGRQCADSLLKCRYKTNTDREDIPILLLITAGILIGNLNLEFPKINIAKGLPVMVRVIFFFLYKKIKFLFNMSLAKFIFKSLKLFFVMIFKVLFCNYKLYSRQGSRLKKKKK